MVLRPSLSCPCLVVAVLALTVSTTSSRAEDRVLKPGKPEQVGMSGAFSSAGLPMSFRERLSDQGLVDVGSSSHRASARKAWAVLM